MANYKVPQDVEADDKLLGPFSFRQFIYLMIVLGMVVLAVALFKIFPLLVLIPIPIALFFAILALPLKKDQPMETYLAALVSFYLKPHKRFWAPGQSDSTILITAPKKVEPSRVRNITGEEATHRLSFLAEVVDSEGYSIKNANSSMRDEFYAEAYNATDIFDAYGSPHLDNLIDQEQQDRHNEIVNQMRIAIENSDYNHDKPLSPTTNNNFANQHVIQPLSQTPQKPNNPIVQPTVQPSIQPATQPTIPIPKELNELAHNPDYTVETIQQEADRIRKENESEVYVSLH